eukprot:3745840-Rhodomonas_salina.1
MTRSMSAASTPSRARNAFPASTPSLSLPLRDGDGDARVRKVDRLMHACAEHIVCETCTCSRGRRA